MRKNISIIIPAFNEERSLVDTVNVALSAVEALKISCEILIIDDGSSDNTNVIAQNLSSNHSNISLITHQINLGIGAAYKSGVKHASQEYLILLPGDNAWPQESVLDILNNIGIKDIIIPYTTSSSDKGIFRKMLSKYYTKLMNGIFNLNIPYYNGIVVHKTNLVKSIEIKSNDFSYQTEVLVKLIKRGYSYHTVAATTRARDGGKSTALKISNIVKLGISITRIYKETILKQNKQ